MGRPTLSEQHLSRDDYIAAWYAALNSPCGVALSAHPIDSVRARLMAVRKELADPALMALDIVRPSHANELWIVRKDR